LVHDLDQILGHVNNNNLLTNACDVSQQIILLSYYS